MTKKNLIATIEIDAAPEQVWSVVSNLRRMPEWSPQCRLMRPLGSLRVGTRTFNLNRRGRKFWPTMSRIERLEPGRAIAFRNLTNNSVWSFEITSAATGSTLTERRTVPPDGTKRSAAFFVEHFLGGEENFDVEVADGMQASLAKIKAAVEQRP